MLTMPEVIEWQIWWWNPFFRLLTQADELRCRLKLKTMRLKMFCYFTWSLHSVSRYFMSAVFLKFNIYLTSCRLRPRSKTNNCFCLFFCYIFFTWIIGLWARLFVSIKILFCNKQCWNIDYIEIFNRCIIFFTFFLYFPKILPTLNGVSF